MTAVSSDMVEVPLHELTAGIAGPVLYVFAHQDDEILVLGKMILEIRAGLAVHAVWITDGRKAANPVKRERESRRAMKRIGVAETNLHFLRYPDQKSVQVIPTAFDQMRSLAKAVAPAHIVSPAYEGGNMDHDVAALVAARVAQEASPQTVHLEYPLYNHYQGRRRVGIFLPDGGGEGRYLKIDQATRDLAQAAARQYRSQRLALWLMGFYANRKALMERGVPYRVAPAHDFLRRPVGEPCDYERSWLHGAKFEDWQRHVTASLKSTRAST